MLQASSCRIGEVKDGRVSRPRRDAEKGVVFFDDAFGVLYKGIKTLFVRCVAAAVPPLETVFSSVNHVGDGWVFVHLNDAVQEEVSSVCTVRPTIRFVVDRSCFSLKLGCRCPG